MAVRRLYEPLCIAFGTTVSSPTAPTYQLYDLPHKFTPRLYMHLARLRPAATDRKDFSISAAFSVRPSSLID